LKTAIRISFILLAAAILFPAVLCAQCTVATIGVNLGSYDPLSASNLTSSGTITVSCSGTYQAAISIGASGNSGGFQPRQMRMISGTDLLNYNLYSDSGMTAIWGDGTQSTSTVVVTAKKPKPASNIVYGRAPSGQNVQVGQYADSLITTINF
jgi:spore coat protein U-like protein